MQQKGQLLLMLGHYDKAIAVFDARVTLQQPVPAQTWVDRGDAERSLKKFKQALNSYRQALSLQPNHSRALNGESYCLAMLNRCKEALAGADQSLALYPEDAEGWLVRGIIFSMMRQTQRSLEQFQKALSLRPDYDRAWYNQGIAQLQLGQDAAALSSLDNALRLCENHHEPWYAMGYVYRALILLRQGRLEATIESCDRALQLNPNLYAAALYRLIALIGSGQMIRHLAVPGHWRSLLHTIKVILNHLRFRLLGLVGVIALVIYGQGFAWLRSALPIVFSVGIVGLLIFELWSHRTKLQFVWQIYFKSGILTYVRAVGILVITLSTYGLVDAIAPPFLRWGWANLIFGQPGNILFQPFTLFEPQATLSPLLASLTAWLPVGAIAGVNALSINWQTAFILGFWLLLVLLLPFWAQLEERIFRRGAQSWRKILIRSVQFGLLHLLAGIPILAGFVLIVPGFLFACRYKYVYDRQFRRTQDVVLAMEAGVHASTADHAVYNAILVTLVVATLTLLQ